MFVKLKWNVCKTYVKSPSSGTSHFWMPKGGPPRGRSENKIIICRLWLHFAVTGYLYCSAYCLLFVYEDIFLCLFTKICLVWLVKICQIDEHFHLSIVDHVHLGVVPAWRSRDRFIWLTWWAFQQMIALYQGSRSKTRSAPREAQKAQHSEIGLPWFDHRGPFWIIMMMMINIILISVMARPFHRRRRGHCPSRQQALRELERLRPDQCEHDHDDERDIDRGWQWCIEIW